MPFSFRLMANHGSAQNDQLLMSKRLVARQHSGMDNVDQKTVVMNNHQRERENLSKAVSRQRHIKNASFCDTVSTTIVCYIVVTLTVEMVSLSCPLDPFQSTFLVFIIVFHHRSVLDYHLNRHGPF